MEYACFVCVIYSLQSRLWRKLNRQEKTMHWLNWNTQSGDENGGAPSVNAMGGRSAMRPRVSLESQRDCSQLACFSFRRCWWKTNSCCSVCHPSSGVRCHLLLNEDLPMMAPTERHAAARIYSIAKSRTQNTCLGKFLLPRCSLVHVVHEPGMWWECKNEN